MDAAHRFERSEQLHAEVCALIDSVDPAGVETDLSSLRSTAEALALQIARFQAAAVPALAQLYASRGIDPAAVDSIDALPSLPADVFRLRRVAAHPPDLDQRRFRTSGTTQGGAARGTHPYRVMGTTVRAAIAWARRMLWPDSPPRRLVVLCPDESQAPDSSLSFMLARFAEHLAPAVASWHFDGAHLDAAGIARACASARDRGEPTLVAGTAFAFAELFERTAKGPLALPPGSRVMPTGGFKGRVRAVNESELREQLVDRFGVPGDHVVGEYGMTELSSQLYEGTLARALGKGCFAAEPGRYYPPPWVWIGAVDPIRHLPLPVGEVGLCRIVDLANVDSSLAILTADQVRLHSDGSATLLGRAPGALARGCSLTIEDALGGRGDGGSALP